MIPEKRFKKLLLTAFAINTLLVTTHEGEFWPYSIFPMFSQAGKPWSRGVVQQIHNRDQPDLWDTKPLHLIEDHIVALKDYDINEIDYANFISKTKNWNAKRIQGLRDFLQIHRYPGQKWLATRVTGHLTEDDSIIVEAIPMFLFTADSTFKNPNLFKKETTTITSVNE